MNYLLHNMGYDKPINFREIVLRVYKDRCMWLRDTYFDRLNPYFYEQWLPNIKYQYESLERDQECLKKAQNELCSLTDEKLQEMYAKEVSKIETLHNCHHSYHMDEVVKISRCTDQFYDSLEKWLAIPNTPPWLTKGLFDIYDTAISDLREHKEAEYKAVEQMHNTPIPTFEDFKSETINRIKSNIEFYKKQINDQKKNIKIVEQQIAEVKQLFAWLDEIEEEEK